MARLNVAIGDDLNEWLEVRCHEMNITKTAMVNLALEQYMQSMVLLRKDKGLSEFLDKMEELNKALTNGTIKLVETKD